jgi:EmrB/QacA subfamily drug resistance transporter
MSLTTPQAGTSDGGSSGAQSGSRRWAVLAVLCVSLLVVSLDNTILNVALPDIVRDLHASSSQLQWIVDAYAIVFAGLMLVLGSLGDRIGRKRVFVVGLVLFAAGSAASAFSRSPNTLIASRAFMGIGGASIMPSTLSILTDVFTGEQERARAIGIWSGTTGIGVSVGPIVGGWLLAHFWWGSVFLVNVPIAALGVAASMWLVPDSKNPRSQRPDPVGAALSIVGMGMLLWGIIEAPNRTWSSPLIIGSIAGAVAVLTGFVFWELHSDHPMLDVSFFTSRRFSAAIGSMSLVVFSLFGGLFLLTQYLQFSLGYSAFQAGLRVAPIALTILVVAPASSFLVRWLGTKVVVVTGMATIAVGFAIVSRTTVAGTYIDALPGLFLLGIGTGLALAPSTESVMGSLPRERTGVGSATNGAALQLGGALGVGVLGSLLASRYRGVLHPVLAHEVIPKSVLSLINGSLGGALAVAAHVGGAEGAALAAISRRGFVSGMDLAVTAATVVVSVGAVMALGMLPSRAPPATSLGPGSGVSAPAGPAPAGPAPAEPAPVGTEVRTSEGRLQAP